MQALLGLVDGDEEGGVVGQRWGAVRDTGERVRARRSLNILKSTKVTRWPENAKGGIRAKFKSFKAEYTRGLTRSLSVFKLLQAF